MSSHLIYHPKRNVGKFGDRVVHFDSPSGNQDPYVWSRSFLHTYCHMPQLRDPLPGDINFWVSSPTFPCFSVLLCDLVFVVRERHEWKSRNEISQNDPIVDSQLAYQDHYRWVERQHHFKRRLRKTLKADPTLSFQPQTADGALIDIAPLLGELGYSVNYLRMSMVNGWQSKPMPVTRECADRLYANISCHATVKVKGDELEMVRGRHNELASKW